MGQSLKILLVDDQKDFLDLISMLCEMDGAEVTCAMNYNQALAHIDKSEFDIVITDYSMPKMHGLYLLEMIKDIQPDLPVIVISAVFTSDIKKQAIDRGADMLLDKPFEYKTLIDGIRDLMRKKWDKDGE